MARSTFYRETPDSEAVLCKISTAKKWLRESKKNPESKACAWTEHYDRNGGMFEATMIELTGNNSHFKYNQHL